MKHRLLIATSLLAVSTLASADAGNYKYPQAEALPQDDTSNFQRDPTLLTGYDLNLSADRFAKAWLSKTNEWCKGRPFLPNTLHEFLYSRFANLSKQQGEERASKIIIDGMKELRPCKKESDK